MDKERSTERTDEEDRYNRDYVITDASAYESTPNCTNIIPA